MDLNAQLLSLGVSSGDLVMVHASMRRVRGRAEDVVRALLSVVGPSGTLAAYVDFEPTVAVPRFDVTRSPASASHGVLAEIVRTWPGAQRSRNPGASMSAVGARADWLCADHPMNYGYGQGSPLAKIADHAGKVLLLGADFDHVTMLHYAEHVARLPHKRVVTYPMTVPAGELSIEEFDTSRPVVAAMPERYFDGVVRACIAAGLARTGPVGGATAHLFSADVLTRFAVAKMESEFG